MNKYEFLIATAAIFSTVIVIFRFFDFLEKKIEAKNFSEEKIRGNDEKFCRWKINN